METLRTVSTFAMHTENAMHVLHISGYSQHRGRGTSYFIRSGRFSVGGHFWTLMLYPNGTNASNEQEKTRDCVVVALSHLNSDEVWASYEVKLVNQITGSSLTFLKEAPRLFNLSDTSFAISRKLFESPTYLQDDCLTIHCIVTTIKEPRGIPATKSFPRIQVPPSNISRDFARLLDENKGADVTFTVGEENFAAHRIILATRSPVFDAELLGPMREAGTAPIVIEDIQPDVFRSLLHYIYTDSMPRLDDLPADDYRALVCHLLVAADRYAMERLNLICQSILCENLTVQNVATTLALADQRHCDKLKDACTEFMASSSVTMDAVAATQGYKNLKRTCPSVVIEALEKTSRIRKA